jgi:hypothetical protein
VLATQIFLDTDGSLLKDNNLDGVVDYDATEKVTHQVINEHGESLGDYCSIITVYSPKPTNL